ARRGVGRHAHHSRRTPLDSHGRAREDRAGLNQEFSCTTTMRTSKLVPIFLLGVAGLAHAQRVHTLMPSPSTVAFGYYDAAAAPVLRVQSGDEVIVGTMITSSPTRLEQVGVKPNDVQASLRAIYDSVKNRGPGGHILTGPIFVEGADSGDVLEVHIESIDLAIPYAYNGFSPGRGFLPEDFNAARTKIIPLDRTRMIGTFAPG